MCAVGKAPRPSKSATLEMLKRKLGKHKMAELDRARLIKFSRDRAIEGCGPETLGIDIGTIKLVLAHAAAAHGLAVQVEPVDLARIALKRLHLIGKGQECDRRPTQEEPDKLIVHFGGNPRQVAPVARIIRFAVGTAMRQDEICRVTWSDVDSQSKMLTIRDRKDPRNKSGNNQRIPLLLRRSIKMPGRSSKSSDSPAATKTPEYSLSTADRSEQHSGAAALI